MVSNKALWMLFAGFLLILSCTNTGEPVNKSSRLQVVATIFPLYDFARKVGGDKVSVAMLIPPGSDAHHFELKPSDIVMVSKSDIFLFTSFEMEQWAYKIINAAAEKTNMLAVETGQGTALLPWSSGQGHVDADHQTALPESDLKHSAQYDPHIWLDFINAQKMIDNISTAFINKDPKNSEYYKNNAKAYKLQLMELDKKYKTQLSRCKTRTILHAGHWAFAYLAERYQLSYLSAYNMSADAEPTPLQMLTLIREIKKQKLRHIYYEDMVAPNLAQTVAQETGATLLKLNNGHDVAKEDIDSGVSFIGLMERNLENLKTGMICP